MTRLLLVAALLWSIGAGTAAAQTHASLAPPARAELQREALTDPVLRRERIRALRLSIGELRLQQSAIDVGVPIGLTVLGAIGFAGGAAVAIAVPLLAALGAAFVSTSSCALTLGYSCDSGSTPEWVPLVAGIGAGVGLVGLIALVLGASALRFARAQRRPLRNAERRDREELELLESIDVAIGDRAGVVSLRARF